MLDDLRKHSSSFFLILMVATLATLFGVSWGPGARGCSSSDWKIHYVAKVRGYTVSEVEYTSARRLVPQVVRTQLDDTAAAGTLRQGVLDGLIERELLAQEAERLGFRVTEAQVNEELRNCRVFISVGLSSESAIGYSGRQLINPLNCTGGGESFSWDTANRRYRALYGMSVADIRRIMAREMLAQRMREVVKASVQVGDEELWRDYRRSHDQTAVRYLRFEGRFYRNLVRDDDDAVDAWAQAHRADIDREYASARENNQGLPRQLLTRHILLRFPSGATDAQKGEVRQRAQALRTQLAAPGADFVRLARLYSEDSTWPEGGQTDWRTPSRDTDEARAPYWTAANALARNAVSQPVEVGEGLWIIQLLDTREGNVPEPNVRREIARRLYRAARANELLAQAARDAHRRLSQGEDLDAVSRALRAAALQEFYRGAIPAALTVAPNVSLTPMERADLGAPEATDSQQFNREGSVVDGLEHGEVLTRAAFALSPEHPLAEAPLQVGDDWFVLRHKDGSRTVATREEFARQRQELVTAVSYRTLLGVRQREALVLYLTRMRAEAERLGEVRVGTSPLLRPPQAGEEEQN
ncbi:MAG: SurA N-terminal domain-containing protein [Deltaproteobacteria bacterium]|nr:SurA N-terminal domain-containing protein [Deltaproteobacteria bacterium]